MSRLAVILSIAASFGAAATIAHGQCAAAFAGANSTPINFPGYALATGDFNADGVLDLALAGPSTHAVLVRMGTGNGQFGPGTPFGNGAGLFPTGVAVGDFDGNGRLDLVTANAGANSVSVLLGNGDGTFTPQTSILVGMSPTFVLVADLNDDEVPDIACTNNLSNDVTLLLGAGAGTFLAPVSFAAGMNPHGMVAADVDRDGHLDLAIANSGAASVSLLRNLGTGSFQPVGTLTVGSVPERIIAADLNADGLADLVTTNFGSDDLSFLAGTPSGSFAPAMAIATAVRPLGVDAADVNGDGRADLVVTSQGSNAVSVHLGASAGMQGRSASVAVGTNPIALVARDVNGDGRADLLTANETSRDVSVALNTSPHVSITAQPQTVTALLGSSASFHVGVAGAGPTVYQWKRVGGPNGGLLVNNGNISGVNGPTLTVRPAALFPSGTLFVCRISNVCGTVVSEPGVLILGPSCPADFNLDGFVEPGDLDEFITLYFQGC